MPFANTEDEYGFLARLFHWVIAFLILALLPVGLGMGEMPRGDARSEVFLLHKSFGLVVFFLGLARLLWRFISPAPEHLESHRPWERALSSAAHVWLYICVIGMPLSGWLMSSAGPFPVPFFGLTMPSLIGQNEHLGDLFFKVHQILAYTLLAVLVLHIAGALKHQIIDRDETLPRMSWKHAGWGLVAILVLYAGLSYSLSALGLWKELHHQEQALVAATAAAPSVPVDTSHLGPHQWAIDPNRSHLTFKTSYNGSKFEGTFKDFNGIIIFDPTDLKSAKADIRIGLKNVTTGDAERDSTIQTSDWFDSDNYPDATFKSLTFESAGEGKYIAVGNLTIRGVSMPLSIPFTLDIQGKEAKMAGTVTLNRLDYKIGDTDEWKDDKTVGHTVTVAIDLTAVQ